MKQELNIFVLGNGGREESLARKIAASPRCAKLFCSFADLSVPGIEIPSDPMDFDAIAAFCTENAVDMLLIGEPAPIVAGIRDFLNDIPTLEEMRIIAPSSQAAMLEGSKEFAKEFMSEACIPSPRFMPVDSDTLQEGLSFLDSLPGPYVLKADGLAQGRGVLIINDLAEAKDALEDMIRGMFGQASSHVLIEEYICGPECSVVIATDGDDYLLLPPARDYKRLLDGDNGPNTPGMGAYSPVAYADAEFMRKVEKFIISPTLKALKERRIDYQGFLYFGIIVLDGEPVLIEYNVRPGDPETQATLPRIDSDIIDILEGIADRTIALKRISINDRGVASVVVLSKGERTLTVTSVADNVCQAAEKAYARIASLRLPDMTFRSDIATLP